MHGASRNVQLEKGVVAIDLNLKVSFGGLIIGILIGLTGMGGGSLMTPMLIFLFNVHPAIAVGTDLMYASITKIVGSIQHIRQKTVDYAALKFLALGSVPGGVLGSLSIGWMEVHLNAEHVNRTIDHLLAAVYILIIIAMMVRWIQKRRGRLAMENPPVPAVKLVILGLTAGYIVGVTSVGSGALYIAVLAWIYPIAAARLVGTDIVQATLVTGVAAVTHLAFGNVDWALVLSLLIGSVPGILIGSRVTARVPDSVVRVAMVIMLCYSSFNLFSK